MAILGRIANFSRVLNLYDMGALSASSSGTGVYLFYRESQTAKSGHEQRPEVWTRYSRRLGHAHVEHSPLKPARTLVIR